MEYEHPNKLQTKPGDLIRSTYALLIPSGTLKPRVLALVLSIGPNTMKLYLLSSSKETIVSFAPSSLVWELVS